MTDTAKNVLIWTIVIVAVALLVWGAFKLLSPGYIDKTRYVARTPGFNPMLPHIGNFNLGPGTGMSYSQSGQLYSPYASGQTPVLKGRDNRQTAPTDDTKGAIDFFEMFGAGQD